MNLLDFSREAYKSADQYLSFLNENENEKGVDTILVNRIIDIGNLKFKLLVSKKIYNLDSTKILINSKLFPFDSNELDKKIRILEANSEEPSVTVRVTLDLYESMLKLNPNDVRLISDLKFLVKATRDWYHKFHKKIFPRRKKNIFASMPMPLDLPKASENQINAIKTALNSDISYVWGAPGTGKTQFVLANCIMNYVRAGKKILLMAPTNNALEQSARGVLKVLHENGIPTNTLLRLGRASTRFAQEYPEVCESTNLDGTLSALKKEINELNHELELQKEYLAFLNKKSEIEKSIIAYEQCNANIDALLSEKQKKADIKKSFESKITVLTDRLNLRKYELSALTKERNSLLSKIRFTFSKEQNYRSLKAIDEKRLEIESLENDIAKNNVLLEQCNSSISRIESEYNFGYKQIASLFSKIKSLSLDLFEKDYGVEKIKIKLDERYKDYISITINPNLESMISDKQSEYDRLAVAQSAEFKNKCIIACTVDYAILRFEDFPQSIDHGAEHIFIDEAAYCPMIKAGVFFAYNIPVTFLGDHMQLPPICEMDDEVIKASNHNIFLWAQSALYFPEVFIENSSFESMYQRFHMYDDINYENIEVAFLNNTYRFGDNLAKILDKFVYHSGFEGLSDSPTQITVIDAPHHTKGGLLRSSPDEVDAIYNYISKNKNELGDFAILTPYKNQLKLLSKKISYKNAEMSTIHASQGREWDTVIISIVDAHNKFFVDSQSKKSNGLRIINTAISRAKKKLVLVLDYEHWKTLEDKQLVSSIAARHTNLITL